MKRPAAKHVDDGRQYQGETAMKFDVKVEATTNEKRRFLGQADVTPMIELVSIMLDSVMLVVVEARLQALATEGAACEDLEEY